MDLFIIVFDMIWLMPMANTVRQRFFYVLFCGEIIYRIIHLKI